MIGDGGDMELIDRGALRFGLQAPIVGDGLEEIEIGVVGGDVDGRRIEESECRDGDGVQPLRALP